MKKLYTSLLVALVLFSCTNDFKEMTITANVSGAEEVIIYLAQPDKIEAIDTVKIENGSFKIGQKIDTADFYTLVFPATKNTVPLYIEPGEQIVLEINAETEKPDYTIKGSVGSDKLQRQWQSYIKTYALIDSLDAVSKQYMDEMGDIPNSVRLVLRNRYMQRIQSHREEIFSIIDEDSTHVTNVMAINQNIGQNRLFDISKDADYYRKINNGLMAMYPDNKSTIAFNEQYEKALLNMENQKRLLEAQENSKVGNIAPNIAMQDPNGQIRSLNDLRGKIVLIDFWASWCVPCRRSNPELVRIYNKYKDQGFDIFSVSLDGEGRQPNPKQAWLDAIKKDQLTWPNHVSDLLGWQSASQKIYGFGSIPHTVLLNEKGFIVAKDVHGQVLEQWIEKLLNDTNS